MKLYKINVTGLNLPLTEEFDLDEHDRELRIEIEREAREKCREMYREGKKDANLECEKCEAEHWDALYRAEMKGRTEAIDSIRGKVNDMYSGIKNKTYADDNWYLSMISVLDEMEGSR